VFVIDNLSNRTFVFTRTNARLAEEMSAGGGGRKDAAAANDDAFISFAFAIVSVVAFVMFVPLLVGALKEIYALVRDKLGGGKSSGASARRSASSDAESVFAGGFEDVGTVVASLKYVASNPGEAVSSLLALLSHARAALRYVLPRFLRFCFRPKVLVLGLWLTLLSSVVYSTLTYDPYVALGLQPTASLSEVKKAYRTLVTINHPDRNDTAEAKVIWPKIQRAYKSIMNKEKGMEDEKEQEEAFSVGVALPSWLLQNQWLAFIIILSVLVFVPYYAYRTLVREADANMQDLFARVERASTDVEHILVDVIGVPEDRALRIKRHERRRIFGALVAVGAIPDPRGVPETVVDANLPPLKELRVKLATKNGQALAEKGHRWLTEELAKRLVQLFNDGDAAADAELQAQNREADAKLARGIALSGSALRAEVFIVSQIFESVHVDLEEYSTAIGAVTQTVNKILKTQKNALDLLRELVAHDAAKQGGACRAVNELAEMPGRFEELGKELRQMTERHKEQKLRDKQAEQIREIAMQNGGRIPPELTEQAMALGLVAGAGPNAGRGGGLGRR
jgi:translocation protein SEC63